MTAACQASQQRISPPTWISVAGGALAREASSAATVPSGRTRCPPSARRSRSASPANSNSRPGSSAAATCGNSRSPKLWRSKAPKRIVGGRCMVGGWLVGYWAEEGGEEGAEEGTEGEGKGERKTSGSPGRQRRIRTERGGPAC